MSEKSKVSVVAASRGVSEVLHFSTNLGLTGSLHTGTLLPRSRLRQEDTLVHILTLNAPFRAEEQAGFDKSENWIDYVNLSLSEITTNLFRHSLRWHADRDVYWIIMSFSLDLLDDDGVYFCTTNNIYSGVRRARGVAGFKALFADRVHRRGVWYATRQGREVHLPTCEQAEVLYPEGLPMSYLKKICVRAGEEADRAYALLSQFGRTDVEVVLDPAKFLGKSN